ncbi:zinc ribbon domain-containing protein [Marinifilum sp.]|uniref:zinc ribbon domain-containing protein n=1 Tax=Marinifilum sp. TaxID=2033137 RepID=UPI003BA88636
MNTSKYICPKCGNGNYVSDEFRATGGRFAKVFDVQNKKFTTITCSRCSYTELYKGTTSQLGNIFDFLTN